MKNIILIGMMGCGKTTVGELLAQRLKKTLVDTDRLIEVRLGRLSRRYLRARGRTTSAR